jgi:drug/metabolite transporter (DMT)-like permease
VTHRKILAVVLWMSGALLAFSATAIAVRALAPSFTVFEILAMRNAAGLAILLAIAALKPALRRELRPRRMGLHLARNSMHFAATYAWTLGVTLLPLATVFALEFTAPAWVTLLAVLLLGEAATGGRVVAVAAGFLGVIVIVRPGLAVLEPASLVVLGAALGFAGTAIVTKVLTRTESVFAILTWMSAMQLVPNLIGSDPAFWTKADATHLLPILAICVSGLLSHYCLTHAYRIGDASMVVPLDFLRIPLIALVGWWLYAEPFDPFVLLGSALIVAGILWNLRAEAAGARA